MKTLIFLMSTEGIDDESACRACMWAVLRELWDSLPRFAVCATIDTLFVSEILFSSYRPSGEEYDFIYFYFSEK